MAPRDGRELIVAAAARDEAALQRVLTEHEDDMLYV
jgi:hypothetical protein